MSRIDIDQTAGRMEDIQNAIDDDPRQVFMYFIDDATVNTGYDKEPPISKRQIQATIYKANRNSSQSGKVKSPNGQSQSARENMYLLTKEELKNIIHFEMDGMRFEVISTEYIRGEYKRVKLKSIENGNKTKGYS